MPSLIIVDDPGDWPLEIPGVEVVAARAYLADPRYTDLRRARVFNLCRSYRYQSIGYYVSLLAAARGHKPLPNVATVQDLKSQTIVRAVSEELDQLIQKSLSHLQAREFILSIYFGRNVAKHYDRLSLHLFKLFQAPFLRAAFAWNEKSRKWQLQNIAPLEASEIPPDHRGFAVEVAKEYFAGRRRSIPKKTSPRFDLAILVDPREQEPPSDARALQRFIRAAEAVGLSAELIEKEDFGRLSEFDALFIRETTSVNHHTYRFARRAMAEGLVVVDDPDSILKCTNKVFLAELLERQKIATPKTLIVHRDNRSSIADTLGFPCILKQPDSSFSQGVVKVETAEELKEAVDRLLAKSDLIIAQEFLPTTFDWRVGVFDRQPLYVCKYFMAKKHWQIIRRDGPDGKRAYGKVETVPVEHAPTQVVRTALRAAGLIGDGLYGVDLKQVGKSLYVIEVNDNPNIDSGTEDAVLKDELYLRVMRVLLRRLERRKERLW
jgi:glutathione synthase/RimK-type ligase-like ATP-grasp enzyme